jgi:hypothetical protein
MANVKSSAFDGGVKSRKMWFAVGTAVLILCGGLLSAHYPAFAANYEVFVGGQLGALAIYSGSNVGAKFVGGRRQSKAAADDE